MRPVKELADVANKLEVLEDIVEQLQFIIADITNVITKCSSWIVEKDDTTYQEIKQMLVSKTCDYVKQFFLMAHEKNGKLSEPVNTDEEMHTVTGIQTIEAPGSDIKGSLDYKRLQENLKEIATSIKSHSEMIEVLQKRNKSLVKGNIKEITANVKTHSDMIESLQEKNKVLEKISEKLLKQNQANEKLCAEHYKEIVAELSVASSFMSNIKDENIKLIMKMTEHNKKVDDVSDRVYKGMEIVSEFAKDQHILNELQRRNKELADQSTKDQHHLDELRKEIQKLTDDSVELKQHLDNANESIERFKDENVELRQHLDNAKKSIERFKEENGNYQASLKTKEFENQKLTEKLVCLTVEAPSKIYRPSVSIPPSLALLKNSINAKDQHILDKLRKENKKLTDDVFELMQRLDNSKESIERFKEENAKYQASLETKEIENIKLKEKLGFFPKDILERVERSLIDVRKKNINFLLLGQCSTGKSALGNSILQRKCLKVGCSAKPIHTEVQCEKGEFKGRGIRVFELPDPYYLSIFKSEALFKITKYKIVDQCSHGFSVILLVFRFDSKISQEHTHLIETFKTTFGQNSLKDYGILVMTSGDNWKLKFKKEKSFQDWIQHQGYLEKILTECNGRALLFENHTRVKEGQTEQLQNLMDMVDELILDHTFQTKSLTF